METQNLRIPDYIQKSLAIQLKHAQKKPDKTENQVEKQSSKGLYNLLKGFSDYHVTLVKITQNDQSICFTRRSGDGFKPPVIMKEKNILYIQASDKKYILEIKKKSFDENDFGRVVRKYDLITASDAGHRYNYFLSVEVWNSNKQEIKSFDEAFAKSQGNTVEKIVGIFFGLLLFSVASFIFFIIKNG